VAPDLIVHNSTNLGGATNIDLGRSFVANVMIQNLGNVSSGLGPQVGFSFQGANVVLGGGVGFGDTAPGTTSISSTVSISVPSDTANLSQLEAVPFGSSVLVATVDPTDQIYEVNGSGTGETNNTKTFNVNVVAPDLKIFAVGVGPSGTCDPSSGNCILNTSLSSTLTFDVYVLNDGTGIAAAGYPVRVLASNSCFTASTGTGPVLPPGKAVKVPVTVNVSGSGACYNASGVPITAEVNPGPTHTLVEHVNDSNANGVSRGWANNAIVPKRFATSDPGNAPFDPAAKSIDFSDQTAQGGAMGLSAAIRRSDLEAVAGSVNIFEVDGITPVAKLLPGRVYTIKFDVKNNGDGPSSSTETIDAFWVEQGGAARVITLTPVNNAISSVNPGGVPVAKSVTFKAPNDAATWTGTNLIEDNDFKIRVKVNPDNDPNEANTVDNRADSTTGLPVYHVDLTVTNVQAVNSNTNCGPGSSSACPFAVANEPLDVNFTIRANGTSGRDVPASTVRVQFLDASDGVIPIPPQTATIPTFTINSGGVGNASGSVSFPAVPPGAVKAQVNADYGVAPGSVDEADENNNFMQPGLTVHVRPGADGGADLTGSYPNPYTLNGYCSTSEPGVTLTGQWCTVSGGACGSQSSSFPVQFFGNYPTIGTTNKYRLTCAANISGALLVKTDDVNVTGN